MNQEEIAEINREKDEQLEQIEEINDQYDALKSKVLTNYDTWVPTRGYNER